MEWVEVTGKTLDAAQERALDQLGVGRDEAEFDILEEPRSGLFGLLRGEARVRARVKPASVRPKNDRRRRTKEKSSKRNDRDRTRSDGAANEPTSDENETTAVPPNESNRTDANRSKRQGQRAPKSDKKGAASNNGRTSDEKTAMSNDEEFAESPVSPTEVADAAESFLKGLADGFGLDATVDAAVDGETIDVGVNGDELGLMVGPSGRTLNAIQDLTRVAAQRRLGDHVTRLRVDIAGYRERRRVALEAFTRKVAADVLDSGEAKALEPMSSADRKVVHDTVNEIDGVESRSDGDDPARRVVIVPAE